MSKKPVLIGLIVLSLLSFLEIFFYFIYIFKPIDRLRGRDLLTPKGFPESSEVFAPVAMGDYVIRNDDFKKFFTGRLTDFANIISPVFSSNSTFVKSSEANYVIAGTVVSVKVVSDVNTNFNLGTEIVLTNSTGGKYALMLTDQEVQFARIFAITNQGGTYERTQKAITDISKGDYVSVKKSFNLLNPEEVNIDIEILSKGK